MNAVRNPARRQVPAVERAVRALRALAVDDEGRRVSELSRELGLSKSTVSDLLATLEAVSFVERDGASRFRLGFGLLELSAALLRRADAEEAARAALADLREATGETAILHVPSGDGAVIVARAESDAQLKVTAPLGHRLPPLAGSVAKVLLAYRPEHEAEALIRAGGLPAFTPKSITDRRRYLQELEHVRRDGYATDGEEYLRGVRAVTAPVFGEGRVVATLTVVGVAARFGGKRLRDAAAKVASAAAALSARSGAGEAAPRNEGATP